MVLTANWQSALNLFALDSKMTIFYFIYFALFGVLGTLLALGGIDIMNKTWLFIGIYCTVFAIEVASKEI